MNSECNIASIVADDESFMWSLLDGYSLYYYLSLYVVLVFRSDVMDTAEVLLNTDVITAQRSTVKFSAGHVITLLGECV